MKLSITAHARIDGWMGNFAWRIQTSLNKMGLNIASLPEHVRDDVEIVLCDWGSQPSRKAIDVLNLNNECLARLKYAYIDPDTVRTVEQDSRYSSVHATNAAVRRATGQYILSCDSDIYWQPDVMAKIWAAAESGLLGGIDLNHHFFWGARYHIPKVFNMSCPTIPALDQYCEANWRSFDRDKPNPHNFQGAAVALFASKAMWESCGGLDERLIHWGVSDLDIHQRLLMKYKYGGDMDDLGLRFYHFEHYARTDGTRNLNAENPRKANTFVPPTSHRVNDDNWGLKNLPIKGR